MPTASELEILQVIWQRGPSTVRAFGRNVDAFTYLANACDEVHDLTEQMVSLAIHLGAYELHAGWERPRWFPRSHERQP